MHDVLVDEMRQEAAKKKAPRNAKEKSRRPALGPSSSPLAPDPSNTAGENERPEDEARKDPPVQEAGSASRTALMKVINMGVAI
ncbi:hypothetical protein PRNP1_012226 [Phytophthora ramorum]